MQHKSECELIRCPSGIVERDTPEERLAACSCGLSDVLARLPVEGETLTNEDELLTSRMHGSISEYHHAPSGKGPLAAEWKDKPHRLLYDLLGEIRYLKAASQPAETRWQENVLMWLGQYRDLLPPSAVTQLQNLCEVTTEKGADA